eukprot:TRINITY_DN1091_c0_g1_i1.p1 TRINITY_DN1091_c0_g1~~TRINITY_DN1091_c0_g1_i1.p1  ORF type:complete len:336 (-),score=96.05 TRINITY_DN1091_c0_g1_i1:63-1070(-)
MDISKFRHTVGRNVHQTTEGRKSERKRSGTIRDEPNQKKRKRMDPEKDSFVKMDEITKRNKIFLKLFNDIEKMSGSGSSEIEKMPKLILTNIFQFLDAKDLASIFRLNKFFFKFLWTSPNSGTLWEEMCIRQQKGEKVKEREVEQYVMNPTIDKYEKKMGRYLLYFKHCNLFEWDPTNNGDVYQIVNKSKAIYNMNGFDGSNKTLASKNIFKGKQKIELICSYRTNKSAWMTYGVIASNYKEWYTYQHTGNGAGIVATSFGEYQYENNTGPVIEVKVLIDLECKTMSVDCLSDPSKSPTSTNFSNLQRVDEDGVRFAFTITYKDEYFEVKKMRVY